MSSESSICCQSNALGFRLDKARLYRQGNRRKSDERRDLLDLRLDGGPTLSLRRRTWWFRRIPTIVALRRVSVEAQQGDTWSDLHAVRLRESLTRPSAEIASFLIVSRSRASQARRT